MDFLIIYSNYSAPCKELFELFPGLYSTKGVCADTPQMRELLARDFKVVTVPVLLVVDSKRVLQRVIGLESIKHWLWITFNNSETIQGDLPEDVPASLPAVPQPMDFMAPAAPVIMSGAPPSAPAGHTALFEDDLMPPTEPVYSLKGSNSVKAAAEELQRQREQDELLFKKSP